MKKLAIASMLAVVVTGSFAAMMTSKSETSIASALPAESKVSNTAPDQAQPQSVAGMMLTATCGQRQGDLKFTEAELERLARVTTRHPEYAQKACRVFTLRVDA
jgi:hypothetical protein